MNHQALEAMKWITNMRWITNTTDPKHHLAYSYITSIRIPGESREDAWKHFQSFLEGKVLGSPKATEAYTTEQLTAMGMVGVYEEERNEEAGSGS